MQVGQLYRVTYDGKTMEGDWSEMLALVISISMPLQLHIDQSAKVTIVRPCLDWLKDLPVAPKLPVASEIQQSLSPQLQPAPSPAASPVLPAARNRRAVDRVPLPRLVDLGVPLDDNCSSVPSDRRSYDQDEPEADPSQWYPNVAPVKQQWGRLEEAVFEYISRNGSTSATLIAKKLSESPVRIGKAATASLRLERVGNFIDIKKSRSQKVEPTPSPATDLPVAEEPATAEPTVWPTSEEPTAIDS